MGEATMKWQRIQQQKRCMETKQIGSSEDIQKILLKLGATNQVLPTKPQVWEIIGEAPYFGASNLPEIHLHSFICCELYNMPMLQTERRSICIYTIYYSSCSAPRAMNSSMMPLHVMISGMLPKITAQIINTQKKRIAKGRFSFPSLFTNKS